MPNLGHIALSSNPIEELSPLFELSILQFLYLYENEAIQCSQVNTLSEKLIYVGITSCLN